MYDLMEMKRVSESYDLPVPHCDDVIGFHAADWANEIKPKGRILMQNAKKYQNCRGAVVGANDEAPTEVFKKTKRLIVITSHFAR